MPRLSKADLAGIDADVDESDDDWEADEVEVEPAADEDRPVNLDLLDA